METPMQKLIILLQEYADSTENLRVKQAYLNSICAIEDYKLVEEEKQMILNAYNKDSISVAQNQASDKHPNKRNTKQTLN